MITLIILLACGLVLDSYKKRLFIFRLIRVERRKTP